jgi:RNA polymerase sigma-54 factor
MKPSLSLKFGQHLTLTPQLQQSIRLLQLSTLELNEEIEQILAENPLLERDDSLGEAMAGGATQVETVSMTEAFGSQLEGADGGPEWSDRESASLSKGTRNDAEDDAPERQTPAAVKSLREHLLAQLIPMRLSLRDRAIVIAMIESLDDDGYLSLELDELLTLMPPEEEVEESELAVGLKLLQSLEPTGVGARSLSEALTLQLQERFAELEGAQAVVCALAIRICTNYLELLGARDFSAIKRLCRCDDDQLREARDLIVGLDPRPGSSFAGEEARYITPDVLVKKIRKRWCVAVNPHAVPKLRLNQLYAGILGREKRSVATAANAEATGIYNQLQEARWLLKNVQQRFETIERVAQAIVERQRHFFDHGEVAMRPLVLREIADELGLHESTISRVTTNKYMLTPRGIFELKYFFGSHVATDTGGACSSTAIRALIKQLVTTEDEKKPLSDSRIAEVLKQQGIVVARRTIAKYRDALRIPPANLRKAL